MYGIDVTKETEAAVSVIWNHPLIPALLYMVLPVVSVVSAIRQPLKYALISSTDGV
ncbi:hypothetical protein D3C73_1608300 [compost metagenome]